jgi:hypothetical protein
MSRQTRANSFLNQQTSSHINHENGSVKTNFVRCFETTSIYAYFHWFIIDKQWILPIWSVSDLTKIMSTCLFDSYRNAF